MSILTMVLILLGLVLSAGLVWFYRDYILHTWKLNKRKISAVATTATVIGAGGTAMILEDFVPSGYRPPIETLISTSNGDYYPVTTTGLQAAIYSMNNESGLIKVGNDLSPSSEIIMGEHVVLDFQYYNVTPSSSFDMFIMKPHCTIKNMVVDITVTDFTDTVFFYNGSDPYGMYDTPGRIENVYVHSHDKQGTLIEMIATEGGEHVAFNDFKDIKGYSMEYFVHMNASNSGAGIAWINNNRFYNLYGATIDHFIYMDRTGPGTTSISENVFTDFTFVFGSGSQAMIYCEGGLNAFVGQSSDYSAGPEVELINISGPQNWVVTNVEYETACTFDNVSITGNSNHVIDTSSWYTRWDNIYNRENMAIYSVKYLDLQSGNALRLQKSADNDIWCFSSCAEGETKSIYMYGYKTGESQGYLRFGYGINSQDASFITSKGGIRLRPNDDNVTIEDILTLNPRTATPLGATEGMIYVNSTDHHCYCYLNGAWKQLDN